MTEKPHQGNRPDDESPQNDADGIQWEELDFDDLLDEVEPQKEEGALPERSGGGDAAAADVTADAAGAASDDDLEVLDDLLDVDDASGKDGAAETVGETPEELDLDDLLAEDREARGAEAQPGSSETSDAVGASEVEELLADDFLAEDVSAEDVSAEGRSEAASPTAGEAAEVGPEGGEETADVAAAAPSQRKGRGLKKLGKKSAALSRKDKAEKRPKAEKKERRLATTREKAAPKEPKSSGVGAGAITFVCSECYEELLLSPKHSQDVVTCPECLHVGKRPDDDFLRTVRMHKSGEQRSFLAAVVCGTILAVLIVALFWTHSPYTTQAPADNLTLGLLGGAGILTLVFLWLIWRFEGNRWEVYF